MVSIISILVAISPIVILSLFLVQELNDNRGVSIYTERGEDGGWNKLTVDFFFLRGLLSVSWCYLKYVYTLGRFKFAWEAH